MTKAEELVELLRKKYPSPAYAVLEQVRSCTGYVKAIRTCDAMAMSLWASRGISLSGFEVKVSRSDWMSEVKDPTKAEEFQAQCHYWYLLTYDDKVAQLDQIPQSWGWMVKKNGTLYTMKAAPYNATPKIDHYLLASVFRNVTEGHISMKEHKKKVSEAREEQEKFADQRNKELLDDIQEFERISGVKILEQQAWGNRLDWQYKDIGEAVSMVLASKHIHIKRSLEEFREDVTRILERTNEALQVVPETEPSKI